MASASRDQALGHRVASTQGQSTIDGGALAADGRCDGGMAADGRGEAMAMADGRGARRMARALTIMKLLLICFGFV